MTREKHAQFLKKLQDEGYSEKVLRDNATPPWWPSGEEELQLLNNAAGLQEYLIYLVRYTGLKYSELERILSDC